MSENIRVKSIVGRFLEHGRIVSFRQRQQTASDQALVFISSADWMPRNLTAASRRWCRSRMLRCTARCSMRIMVANLRDTLQSWSLASDGTYTRVPIDEEFSAHTYFMTNPSYRDGAGRCGGASLGSSRAD